MQREESTTVVCEAFDPDVHLSGVVGIYPSEVERN